MGPTSPPPALLVAGRPCPGRRARRRRRRARAGHGNRRGTALGRGGHTRQGPRRAARRARDADGPSLAVPVRRQPGARPDIRRTSASPRRRRGDGRPGALLGPAGRSRARRQLQRGGCAGAAVARGDVRDGRRRGAGTRAAGCRRRRRRSAGGSGSRRRRRPTGLARSPRRCGGARRRAASLARGHGPAPAVAARGARASRVARPLVDHHLRRCGRDGGSGAMARWLAPLLLGPQHWVLHDRNPDLLTLAEADQPGSAADGSAVTVETRLSDVTRLGRDELADATLITASALLDLLTADELVGLMCACAGAGCAVLLTLSVTGRVQWLPADPLDSRVAASFDAHQRRATRRGRLLGPDAVEAAADGFRRLGAEVIVRASPWRLGVD